MSFFFALFLHGGSKLCINNFGVTNTYIHTCIYTCTHTHTYTHTHTHTYAQPIETQTQTYKLVEGHIMVFV